MYNTIGNEYAIDSYLGGKGLAYSSIYSGEPDEKLELCLGCGKCKENCPLELDVPEIIKKLRSRGVSSDIYFFLKSHMLWAYYQTLLRLEEGVE
jgi:L-lactate dehydrogenase complex protein LldG